MEKEDAVYIQWNHKKGGNNVICSNLDGPRGYHTK